ncbi:MAG: hypothetical protein HC898_08960 [Phycisphaerales bacterium]|nr:hypothetical protein [Phycisphaerales bacterium]
MNPAQQCNRIAGLAAELALKSLLPENDSPATGSPGSPRPLQLWQSALGRLLLSKDAHTNCDWARWLELWQNPAMKVTDELGHSRPVYRDLLLHVGLMVMQQIPVPLRPSMNNPPIPPSTVPEHLQWWQWLLQLESAKLNHDPLMPVASILAQLDAVLAQPGEDGSLHPMHPDKSLDGWTWRELLGLHALAHVYTLHPSAHRLDRLREAVAFHMDNTQPDNTTNQPWALPAFVIAGAVTLAEQQLHDVMAHASTLPGNRPPVITGLLLADSARLLQAMQFLEPSHGHGWAL